MKVLVMTVALCAGLAEAGTPLLYTVNSVQYVNPFDFAKAHAGTITGKSTDRQWTLSVKGKTLQLLNNSRTAYLDGQRITLSKPVGYAKGVLLAPHADLTRLLSTAAPVAKATPKATTSVTIKPSTMPQPAKTPTPARVPTPLTAPQVLVTPSTTIAAPPAPTPAPQENPAPPEITTVMTTTPAASSQASRAARNTTGAYVIQSDVPSRTDSLERANYEQDVTPEDMTVDTIVQACHAGVTRHMNATAPTFAPRPIVFAHPDNIYSVRNSVSVSATNTPNRANFTCLTQVKDGKLVMFIDLQTTR